MRLHARLLVMAAIALPFFGCATTRVADTAEALPLAAKTVVVDAGSVEHASSVVNDWGVQVVGIYQTAGGYMLDFRFRVVDAMKAGPLFDRKARPYLVDEATGARFMVPSPPKTGPLRSSVPPKGGMVYWMFFANPGRALPVGRRVTVVIGDFRTPVLFVE